MTDCHHNRESVFCLDCLCPEVELRRCLLALKMILRISNEKKVKQICKDLLDPERRYGPVSEVSQAKAAGRLHSGDDESKRLDCGRQTVGKDLHRLQRGETGEKK